jgi:hypothetical protein
VKEALKVRPVLAGEVEAEVLELETTVDVEEAVGTGAAATDVTAFEVDGAGGVEVEELVEVVAGATAEEVSSRHCEYQGFCSTQVQPSVQSVNPVQPMPPHCSHGP